ncbi:MFS transporter [Domibacillus sp. DTU_2020_1001157_1_SI_ALB_TIR_016]|uniref:MFS transporter n=1 Tax=Domibacillus sp. DTU_2020_1001157_1_SI_ALB_TIR_016 TaxID=3077789 RepID=UPI0028F1710D|nr:MFS transporter [Domibacillus sp. DTU_2020_1001157_1_SI_ALB_TIR_016]WNS80221.1 MFS transporter [Domibacillus sp. DTU_2020_1001157_1_SI_ALB_TIR_016]
MNTYTKAASGLYVNYFLLGMVNIILSSNMASLSEQWDTDKAGISYIISAIGIGKLLTYALSGHLSDRFGRKPLVIFAALAMGIFLVGIPLSPVYEVAFMFALLAGVANSAMDAGSYPGLVEIFPRSSGSANVMVKAFISLGAALLPFMILFFANQGASYSYAFFVPAAIFFFNMLFLMTVTFPDHRAIVASQAAENAGQSKFLSEPKFSREGIALVIIGFTSTGLFTVAQIWLPSYGEEVLGMAADSAVKLLSYYSIGALISVLSLSILLKKMVRPVTVIVIYPIMTLIAITTILMVKVPAVAVVTAFFIGFSTAGIFQLAITIITELFWQKKGTVTGIVATAGGLAAIVMPLLTGLLSETGNIAIIFIFDAFLAVIGFVAAAFVYYRYGKIVRKSKGADIERKVLS